MKSENKEQKPQYSNRRPKMLRPVNVSAIPDLPITAKQDLIVATIKKNPVTIISGETGSGKTTQIPKFCISAGRGKKGLIGCTQPRRIAAINVARRIAQELNQSLGQSIGYKIRFEDKTNNQTCIKLMTDGVLLAETQTDRLLKKYDTIIVDEAHERSLNIDFTLGILRRLVKKRKDLKLIITSATIDTEKFSKAFGNAPVIEVSGRTFPVETLYQPVTTEENSANIIEDQGYIDAATNAVNNLLSRGGRGDILVFMPTEQDITDTLDILRGSSRTGVTYLPLFARLSAKEQSKIFSRQVGRKVIVSTNVAETSLTIPGVKYVIDTGLARIPTYSPRTRTTELPVSPISQSSANQRQGRCGRVENGVCIRLYDEDDFGSRPFFTSPEILRSNLAEVILRMIFLNLGEVSTFPFIDAPSAKSIQDGFQTLIELGALKENRKTRISRKQGKKHYKLTRIGKIMARLPIDPKLSRILIEADQKGCLKEATIITTALAIPDPRQRPADKKQAADQQHGKFKDPASDFITLLNIWNEFKQSEKKLKSRAKLVRFCQDHFLSFKRMREWNDIQYQIGKILKEYKIVGKRRPKLSTGSKGLKSKTFEIGGPQYIAIHQALLSGYLSNIAHKKEKNIFIAAKGKQAMVFPGSGLFNSAGNWIVAAEFVKTSQVYARTCAQIDPEWVEPIAKELCTHTYADPHWEKKQGRVTAKEQVSLFGLILVSNRKIAYGKINPLESGDIFIRHALVQGEIYHQFDFMAHNKKLIENLEEVENKLRTKDILASDDEMFLFYKSRLPKPFYSIQSFAKFLKDQKNQDFLKMTIQDLQKTSVDTDQMAQFPDIITMPEGKFKLGYQFEPGSDQDGVTINVPASNAALVSEHALDTLVPGLFEEKIAALIRSLPKKYRVKLVPVSEKAKIIASQMPKEDRPLFSMLSGFIQSRFNTLIPATAWSEDDLPEHLKMRISIRDDKNIEIKAVRDKHVLRQFAQKVPEPKTDAFKAARNNFKKNNITRWNFPDLDPFIVINTSGEYTLKGYPSLILDSDSKSGEKKLNLELLRSEKQSKEYHKKGIKQLFLICFQEDFKALKKDINRSAQIKQAAPYFSGQTQFQTDLHDLIVKTVFEKNIRTKKEFNTIAEKEIKHLYATGQDFIKSINKLSHEYQSCFQLIQDLSFKYQQKPKTSAILSLIFNDLKNLVPANFLKLYTFERIKQLHRYVAGYRVRAQKAVDSPLKDEKKSVLVKKYQNRLENLLAALTPESSPEKTETVEKFFWQLEEYKISVFAQGIKTNEKISPKKLDQALIRLSAMI